MPTPTRVFNCNSPRAPEYFSVPPVEMGDIPTPPGIAGDIEVKQTLSLQEVNITAVIWATGHRFDFSWVHLPIFDTLGAPIQNRGVTSCRGVYFLGLHWMHNFKSGLLSFVGEDAAYLTEYKHSKRSVPEQRAPQA